MTGLAPSRLPGTMGAALILLLASCGGDPAPARKPGPGAGAPAPERDDGFRFVDVAAEAGLTVTVHAGRPGKDHLLDSAGNGVAFLDYDRDGWLDAYVVNGWKIAGDQVEARGRNTLYHNRGDGTFEDVTAHAGVSGEGRWGCGVAVADYDGDGWPDMLVTCFGENLLYRNRGDGTFEDVAAQAGIQAPGWNTGAAFFDAEGDGDLDLYIAAYIDSTMEEVLAAERTLSWKGVEQVAFGPFGLPGASDHFFLSDGQGKFEDATESAGLVDRALGFGFTVRAADFDGDEVPDLFVANDSDANYLYRGTGDASFRDISLFCGAAFDAGGAAQAGMGVATGDVNGDGLLDLFVTNFAEDFSTLYVASPGALFEDRSRTSGLGPATFRPLSWGTSLADLDCDGDLDLVVVNGHIYPQVDRHVELVGPYRQPNQLFENLGDVRFQEVSREAGPGFDIARSSRGLAVGDYDNDGDLDLLISNLDEPVNLLRNDSGRGHWLTVVCEVPPGAGTRIGTRVTVQTGDRIMVRDLASGDSYLSCHDARLHFGLGDATRVDRVEVRWPDRTSSVLTDVECDQFVTVRKEP